MSSSKDVPSSSTAIDKNPVTELIKPKLTTSIKDGQIGVQPGIPVTAQALDGVLSGVTLLAPDRTVIRGELSADGKSWHNTDPLGFNRTYRLTVDAMGLGGMSTTTQAFTTSAPANMTQPYLVPDDGEVVGIGQPVSVRFDENIPDRLAAQNAIKVTTDPPVAGAFYWLNDREVRWRPEKFWNPGTKVHVDVMAYGKNFGRNLFGQGDAHINFTVGDAVIFTADDVTHHVVVTRNGTVIRDMPTSMGKPDAPTPRGIYFVGGRSKQIIMDSSTFGVPVNSPGGYRVPVDWATQLAYNGIYMHSAPWSLAQQGNSDASHGCLNLSPADAQWVYETTHRGDVTIVKNTIGPVLDGRDGLGDWNVPWPVWLAGNADRS